MRVEIYLISLLALLLVLNPVLAEERYDLQPLFDFDDPKCLVDIYGPNDGSMIYPLEYFVPIVLTISDDDAKNVEVLVEITGGEITDCWKGGLILVSKSATSVILESEEDVKIPFGQALPLAITVRPSTYADSLTIRVTVHFFDWDDDEEFSNNSEQTYTIVSSYTMDPKEYYKKLAIHRKNTAQALLNCLNALYNNDDPYYYVKQVSRGFASVYEDILESLFDEVVTSPIPSPYSDILSTYKTFYTLQEPDEDFPYIGGVLSIISDMVSDIVFRFILESSTYFPELRVNLNKYIDELTEEINYWNSSPPDYGSLKNLYWLGPGVYGDDERDSTAEIYDKAFRLKNDFYSHYQNESDYQLKLKYKYVYSLSAIIERWAYNENKLIISVLEKAATKPDPQFLEEPPNTLRANLGEILILNFKVKNNGGFVRGKNAYLSMSFSDGLEIVDYCSSCQDMEFDLYNPGDLAWFSDGQRHPLTYKLLDIYSNYYPGEVCNISIKVRVTESSDQWVKYRLAFMPETDTTYVRYPTSGETDQQGWYAKTITISPPSPQPLIRVNPTSLDFGEVQVGDKVEDVVTIYNDGNETLTIYSIERVSGSSDFIYVPFSVPDTAPPFDIPPKSSLNIVFRFEPTNIGCETAEFAITSNDPNNPTVTVYLSGTGVSTSLNNPPSITLLYPPNGAIIYDTLVMLEWNGVDPDGDQLIYNLYFGTSPDPPLYLPSITYKTFTIPVLPGNTYYWKVIAKDGKGGIASSEVWNFTVVRQKQPPIAFFNFFPDYVFTGHTITFNASTSYDPDGSIVSYYWDFGDGSTASGMTVTHVYNLPSNYTVTLTVTDNDGLTSSTSFEVRVYPAPVVHLISPQDGAVIHTDDVHLLWSPDWSPNERPCVFLSWSLENPTDCLITYEVYFGTTSDPPLINEGLLDPVYYLPISTGTYYWKIVARDECIGKIAESDVWSFRVMLEPEVQIYWEPPSPISGEPATFEALCYDLDGYIVSYEWDFGDGNVTITNQPVINHTYLTPGIYTVTLTVTDNDGLTSSTNITITVFGPEPDTYEPDNIMAEASLINFSIPQHHNFYPAGDADWIKFYATAGMTYVIETFDLNVSSNTYIYLYDCDGNLLAENDDYSGLASRIEWTCQQSGYYYVKVRHFDESAYGAGTDYWIRVYEVTTPGPGSEPNTPEPANVQIILPSKTIRLNSTGQVVILTNTTSLIRSIQLNVSFDPSIVQVVNVITTSNSASYNINNQMGVVTIWITNSSGMYPREVAKITFKGTAIGTTPVNIVIIDITDIQNNSLNYAVINSSITVIPQPDINGDKKFDLNDVVYIAYMVVGKIRPNVMADFNHNGRVDIGDLAKIVYYLLGKIKRL